MLKERVKIFIYSVITTIIISIISVAYVFYLQTLLTTKTKSNIGVNTREVATFLDNYVENNYELIESSIENTEYDKNLFLTMFLRENQKLGFSKIGYYDNDTNEYYYESLTTKKSGFFDFNYIGKEKTLNQKISIIEERYLLNNDSRETMILYRVDKGDDKFFILQNFDVIRELIINPYNASGDETNVYYLISTKDGIITTSSFLNKPLLTMNGVFGNDITRDEFNEQFKDGSVCMLELGRFNNFYVAEYSIVSEYNNLDLCLYGLVTTSYIDGLSKVIHYTTLIYIVIFVVTIFAFAMALYVKFLYLGKKYVKDGSLIRDENHYSILLDRKGRILSNNAKFASLGLKKRGIFSSYVEVLELVGNNDEFMRLLNTRAEFAAKVKDLDGNDKTIKFLVIKKNIGYQLLGYDPTEISVIPLGKEKEHKKNLIQHKETEKTKTSEGNIYNNLNVESLFRDDLYDIYNKKALYIKLKKIIDERAVNDKNTYLFYFGSANEEEIQRTYGAAIEELVNNSMINTIKEEIEGVEIYNIDDHHFAFLYEIPDTFHTLTKMMERIAEVMKKPAKILSNEIEIEIDFGIYHFASFNLDKATPKKLVERAALSFKQATSVMNKIYILYDNNLEVAFELDDIIARDIRNGLDNNEFVTYFQPNYSLKDDRVSGFECLLRWNNEKYRYDSPFKYIQVAEKVGLINEIGYFTLVESFKLIKELNDPFLHISVNVSPAQFLQPGFISRLVEMYTEYDVPYSSICIEITETFLIQSMNEVIQKLRYLRSFGIKIYLDDFGTGYSSLLYLAELPVDVIKIDKAFITPLKTSKSSRTIVSELIQIANELNMETVAEGVEDDYQVNFLEKKKCNNIQGYYFSKPVSKEDVREALNIKRKRK